MSSRIGHHASLASPLDVARTPVLHLALEHRSERLFTLDPQSARPTHRKAFMTITAAHPSVAPIPGARALTTAGHLQHVPNHPLRVTVRGRVVALLLVGLAVLLAVVLLGGSPLAPPASGDMQRVALQQVTVLPGQTLWSIADSTEPTGDIRDRIAEIRALNNLESSSLVAGQQLLVPLG